VTFQKEEDYPIPKKKKDLKKSYDCAKVEEQNRSPQRERKKKRSFSQR
jgi:hypothetical protein